MSAERETTRPERASMVSVRKSGNSLGLVEGERENKTYSVWGIDYDSLRPGSKEVFCLFRYYI